MKSIKLTDKPTEGKLPIALLFKPESPGASAPEQNVNVFPEDNSSYYTGHNITKV